MRWHGRCRFGANGQHVGFMEFDRFGVLDCRSEKERESTGEQGCPEVVFCLILRVRE